MNKLYEPSLAEVVQALIVPPWPPAQSPMDRSRPDAAVADRQPTLGVLLEAPSPVTVNAQRAHSASLERFDKEGAGFISPPRYRILRQMDAIFGSIIRRFE
ncbi:MAG: hypothetical protein DLM67_21150 [Candidatus Nephthysia bennettiae]|uniref:EF-hand domain-containing protein n=1 Tax=Candidatus Nephthysia bennettiae TaxID=3127016 RepID=A0A934KBV2_9BACT|nr:hypothetical protein [Candidatus Dormibacteraeota bacterium]PZR88086.1 MAG: hypothetical protein DLM67_21150 [Candidatus Dormibacteraeota bacterium]